MGLVGESGSGKSTAGQGRPRPGAGRTRARVDLAGQDITRLAAGARRPWAAALQAVFQDPNSSLNPSCTIGAQPGRADARPGRSGPRREIATSAPRACCEDVGLDPGRGRPLPAAVLRRAAAADLHRPGAHDLAPGGDLRRGGQRAGPVGAGADPQPARRPAGRARRSATCSSPTTCPWSGTCATTSPSCTGARSWRAGPTRVVTPRPAHPYTRALLLAAPVADPAPCSASAARHARHAAAPTPRPRRSSAGCPFAPRCPFAGDVLGHPAAACARCPTAAPSPATATPSGNWRPASPPARSGRTARRRRRQHLLPDRPPTPPPQIWSPPCPSTPSSSRCSPRFPRCPSASTTGTPFALRDAQAATR